MNRSTITTGLYGGLRPPLDTPVHGSRAFPGGLVQRLMTDIDQLGQAYPYVRHKLPSLCTGINALQQLRGDSIRMQAQQQHIINEQAMLIQERTQEINVLEIANKNGHEYVQELERVIRNHLATKNELENIIDLASVEYNRVSSDLATTEKSLEESQAETESLLRQLAQVKDVSQDRYNNLLHMEESIAIKDDAYEGLQKSADKEKQELCARIKFLEDKARMSSLAGYQSTRECFLGKGSPNHGLKKPAETGLPEHVCEDSGFVDDAQQVGDDEEVVEEEDEAEHRVFKPQPMRLVQMDLSQDVAESTEHHRMIYKSDIISVRSSDDESGVGDDDEAEPLMEVGDDEELEHKSVSEILDQVIKREVDSSNSSDHSAIDEDEEYKRITRLFGFVESLNKPIEPTKTTTDSESGSVLESGIEEEIDDKDYRQMCDQFTDIEKRQEADPQLFKYESESDIDYKPQSPSPPIAANIKQESSCSPSVQISVAQGYIFEGKEDLHSTTPSQEQTYGENGEFRGCQNHSTGPSKSAIEHTCSDKKRSYQDEDEEETRENHDPASERTEIEAKEAESIDLPDYESEPEYHPNLPGENDDLRQTSGGVSNASSPARKSMQKRSRDEDEHKTEYYRHFKRAKMAW